MNYGLEEILWLLVLFDSIISNIIIWFFPKWYNKKFKGMTKYFPATKGWGLLYLILVIWIGYALIRIEPNIENIKEKASKDCQLIEEYIPTEKDNIQSITGTGLEVGGVNVRPKGCMWNPDKGWHKTKKN